ncbi:hypothetical protein JHK87_044888 [Glycine soja]|nr:hypothetical protein JHK87_044888 [Glycine soja]
MQASQKGLIGITLNSDWYMPVSKEKSNRDAARRGLDFMFGWITGKISQTTPENAKQSKCNLHIENSPSRRWEMPAQM